VSIALDDLESEFRARFEPLDALTPKAAWAALLSSARQPVSRTRTPHSADDFVVFEVTPAPDGRCVVTLERRVARFATDGDYVGTAVFGCYLTVDDAEGGSALGPWAAEGYVSNYERLDGLDDRPSMEAFRTEVERSPVFAAFCRARVIKTRIAVFPA
jgi:hypothetical protein